MTPTQIAILALQGVVFIVWAFVWFRTLFRLKREADADRARRGVGYFGGIPIMLDMFGKFFTHPNYAPDRRIVSRPRRSATNIASRPARLCLTK